MSETYWWQARPSWLALTYGRDVNTNTDTNTNTGIDTNTDTDTNTGIDTNTNMKQHKYEYK